MGGIHYLTIVLLLLVTTALCPSLESNSNSPLLVIATVDQYPTVGVLVVLGFLLGSVWLHVDPFDFILVALAPLWFLWLWSSLHLDWLSVPPRSIFDDFHSLLARSALFWASDFAELGGTIC